MSAFLLAPDFRRLAQLLVLNQPAPPAKLSRLSLSRRWMRIGAGLVKAAAVWWLASMHWSWYERIYIHPEHPPIYGLFEVENFMRNGKESPALLSDGRRWHWLFVPSAEQATVVTMNDGSQYYGASQQAAKNTITLSNRLEKSAFSYSWKDTNHLLLRGPVAEDVLDVSLRKVAPSNFLLLNRGFHWINEYPLNR